MVEFLFLDLDDTILDFHKAEHIALGKTLQSFGLEPVQSVLDRYSLINKDHWERLERKELTREQVLVGRFDVLFREYGMEIDPVQCARTYEHNLSIGHYFLPGAYEAVESLSKKYKLYLASNGTARVQAGRLESANISHFFQEIFVSQTMGANKPDIAYFNAVAAKIPHFDRKKALVVGDSLSSDMRGGIGAGIDTCWFNPKNKTSPAELPITYTIRTLEELIPLVLGT